MVNRQPQRLLGFCVGVHGCRWRAGGASEFGDARRRRWGADVTRQLFDDSFPMDTPNPKLVRARMNFAESESSINSRERPLTYLVAPQTSSSPTPTLVRPLPSPSSP